MNESEKDPEIHNTSSTDSLNNQRQIEEDVKELPVRFSISYSQKKQKRSFKKQKIIGNQQKPRGNTIDVKASFVDPKQNQHLDNPPNNQNQNGQ